METKKAKKVLARSWSNKGSPIYLSKNVKTVQRYLRTLGLFLSRKEINTFIESKSSANVRYKNYGQRKIRETGKSFLMQPKWFGFMQGDLLFLSKKKSYRSSARYLVVVIDTLSHFMLIEPSNSTGSEHQIAALKKIMKRIKEVCPSFSGGTLTSDGGSEWIASDVVAMLKSFNVKSNVVKKRKYRESVGASCVESSIRRLRQHLESVLMEDSRSSFKEVLFQVERMCNEETLSSIQMSATEAFQHNPLEVMMLALSIRKKKRKFLRIELEDQQKRVIELGTVVRIKKNQSKDFSSVKKESYEHLSPYFVVLGLDKSREVWTYRLGNILNMKLLSGTYSFNELVIMPIEFQKAREKEEKQIVKIVKRRKDVLYYRIKYQDMFLSANASLLNESL